MGSPVTDATGAMKQLADMLMQRLDTNKDKQLSSDEFSQFLTMLTSAVGGPALGRAVGTSGTTGSGPACVFEGFNFERTQDPQMSCKDAFAALARKAGYMPTTKAGAAEWFNANIKSGLEQFGHKVDWVIGDKFQFTNWQGTVVVDFVRGADGDNPALVWQPEAPSRSFT